MSHDDICKGVTNDSRCELKKITRDHCEYHSKISVKLYKQYKKLNTESEKSMWMLEKNFKITKSFRFDSIVRQINFLFLCHSNIDVATNARIKHHLICYFPVFLDEGHIRYLIHSDNYMRICESNIIILFDRLTNTISDHTNSIYLDISSKIIQMKLKRIRYDLEDKELAKKIKNQIKKYKNIQ
jgi:hypothetical protein